MSSKLFTIAGFNVTAAFNAAAPKFTTGTSLKCLLQLAPVVGGEVVAYGISYDGTSANVPTQVELCEVDQPATGGTPSQIPVSTVATAITATGTTTLVTAAALGPTGTTAQYQVATMALAGQAGGGEQMLVTAGMATTSMTVVRGINGTAPLASIPVGTIVYPVYGSGCPSDVTAVNQQPQADPTYATSFLAGAGLTGFNFSTYPATVKNMRIFDPPQIPPTAPYVIQLPPERGFEFFPGRYLQMRITAGTAVYVMPWITVLI